MLNPPPLAAVSVHTQCHTNAEHQIKHAYAPVRDQILYIFRQVTRAADHTFLLANLTMIKVYASFPLTAESIVNSIAVAL